MGPARAEDSAKRSAGPQLRRGLSAVGQPTHGEAMGMRMYCSGGGNSRSRTIGIILMVLGVLALLLFVPTWVWTSVLAVLLISIGFLIWRFS